MPMYYLRGESIYTLAEGQEYSWSTIEQYARNLGGYLAEISSPNAEERRGESLFIGEILTRQNASKAYIGSSRPRLFIDFYNNWLSTRERRWLSGAPMSESVYDSTTNTGDWSTSPVNADNTVSDAYDWYSGWFSGFVDNYRYVDINRWRYVRAENTYMTYPYVAISTNGLWSPEYIRGNLSIGVVEIPVSTSIGFGEAKERKPLVTTIQLTAGNSSNLAEGVTAYWKVSGIDAQDLISGDLQGIGTIVNGALTLTHLLADDADAGETFTITVYSDEAMTQQVGAAASTAILESDPLVSLEVTPASALEDSAAEMIYTFRLSKPTPSAINVAFKIAGTAKPGEDYQGLVSGAGSGLISIPAGADSATLGLMPTGDSDLEQDETIELTLLDGAGYTVSTTTPVSATILDDDASFSIAARAADRPEGNSGSTSMLFTVTRNGYTGNTSTVDWTISNGPGPSARSSDFIGDTFDMLTFLPGETSQTIEILVSGDNNYEPDETFRVRLTDPSNAVLSPAASIATGVIRNDDTTLTIAAIDADRTEGLKGSTAFTFRVERKGLLLPACSVTWATGPAPSSRGLTSAQITDFAGSGSLAGSINFAGNQSQAFITVSVAADMTQEVDESFQVTLSKAIGATIDPQSSSAIGTIRNDDFVGGEQSDTLIGTSKDDFLNGAGGMDALTGGLGSDVFCFRFGQSSIMRPDRITDFRFGTDQISLLGFASGAGWPAPLRLSRASTNSTANSLSQLSAAVFADCNGAQAGNQPLTANSAAIVVASNQAIAGTYLLINDAIAQRSLSDDVLINVTGYTGTLPDLGIVNVSAVFL